MAPSPGVSVARRAETVPIPDLDHASVGSVKGQGLPTFGVAFIPALFVPAN